MTKDTRHAILLFDGVCKFCHASIQFVIKRDVKNKFVFCPIQSDKGQELLKLHKIQDTGLTSMILLDGDKVFRKSRAALRISRYLKTPWPLMVGFIIIPVFIRDRIYDFIGDHRYQWFGKFDQCMIPDDKTREKFIE